MFDIGWSEMLLVAVIAIVVIGPKDLPAALRQAGKWMGAVRRMASEFQGHVNEAMKEAELDELRKELTDLKKTASGFTNPVHSIRDEMRTAIEGQPAGTTTAPAGPEASVASVMPAPLAQASSGGAEIPPMKSEAVSARPADLLEPAGGAGAHFPPEAEIAAPAKKPRKPRAKKIAAVAESQTGTEP
jgi:sec-independent protein translocase protein TatB